MADRRVFVIWAHPLFHESVRLLLNHPEIEWVGATSDYKTALGDITNLQPDTILIEETEPAAISRVPLRVMEILEACSWNSRVVELNLKDNELSIYHREKRTVGQAEDLLHLIQNY
jgi:DNA-binding NarL/FixJ family response regulator